MAWFKAKKDTVDQTDVVKMLRADLIALDTAHTKVLGTHATLLDGLRRVSATEAIIAARNAPKKGKVTR